MPLPIRDGNQSLTTLSTLIVNSAHVPAHTVVSLGSQAITDIAQAVSGVELGPNTLNALENITVTMGQVTVTGGLTNAELRASSVTVGGSVQVSNFPATQTVTFTQASVTFGTPVVTGSVSVLNFPSTQTIAGTVTIANSVTANSPTRSWIDNFSNPQSAQFFPVAFDYSNNQLAPIPVSDGGFGVLAVQHAGINWNISGTVTANLASANLNSVTIGVRGSVTLGAGTSQIGSVTVGNTTGLTDAVVLGFGNTFGNSDTFKVDIRTPDGSVLDGEASVPVQGTIDIGSLPAISGTVTANGGDFVGTDAGGNTEKSVAIGYWDDNNLEFRQVKSLNDQFPVKIHTSDGVVGDGNSSIPISGTVTVGGFSSVSVGSGAILIAGDRGGTITPIPIDSGSGQVGVQLKQSSGPSIDPISQTNGLWVRQANNSTITVGNSVTIGSIPAISGTVTANASNGSLTTRFGTPTTANTAFATSCVTNANRKYLLIQNVTTGSNVITVGIGFTPTTTQGIQLTAGAGITFESSYIPTGAVQILSSVTASNFTILEA